MLYLGVLKLCMIHIGALNYLRLLLVFLNHTCKVLSIFRLWFLAAVIFPLKLITLLATNCSYVYVCLQFNQIIYRTLEAEQTLQECMCIQKMYCLFAVSSIKTL